MNSEELISILTDARESIDAHLSADADQHWSKVILPWGKDADEYYRERYAKSDVDLMNRINVAIRQLEE